MKKKPLLQVSESEYPKLKRKLQIFEKEYLDAHQNLWKLMHENADWPTLALSRCKSNAMDRRFWDFKEKTNHLPLGFVPCE